MHFGIYHYNESSSMVTLELFLALLAFATVSTVTPGPNNLMLMTSGINFGFARTVPHMLGVGIGFTLMIVLVGVGIIQVLDALPGAQTAIRFASIVYLLYMAWMIATAKPPQADVEDSGAKPLTFLQAAAFQWVNPKAWSTALAAVSAYTPKSNSALGLVILALVFGAISAPTVSLWTLMGAKLRGFLSNPKKLRAFNITAALILVATLYPIVFAVSG
jgi:threonine/homoserine/homoserine lactone efflux protein